MIPLNSIKNLHSSFFSCYLILQCVSLTAVFVIHLLFSSLLFLISLPYILPTPLPSAIFLSCSLFNPYNITIYSLRSSVHPFHSYIPSLSSVILATPPLITPVLSLTIQDNQILHISALQPIPALLQLFLFYICMLPAISVLVCLPCYYFPTCYSCLSSLHC